MPATERAARPPFFRRHPRITLLLVTVGLILVFDVMAAQVLAATDLYVTPLRAETRVRCEHPVYDHDLVPMLTEAPARWGPYPFVITTNSLGFRDREAREVPLRGERPRVVFMGDSFTEGIGVDYAESYVGRIDERLVAAGTEVLNAGVVSYAPIIYWLKARHLLETVGLRFERMVVAIDVSDVYDEVERYAGDAESGVVSLDKNGVDEVLKRFVQKDTVLLEGISRLVRAVRERDRDVDPIDAVRDDRRAAWSYDEAAMAAYGERGVQRATVHMTALHELLQRHGVGLTVVVYPWPCHLLREGESRHVALWRTWAAERGVRLIDLTPDFASAGAPDEVVSRYFLAGDVHWNAAGHAVVADGILRGLR